MDGDCLPYVVLSSMHVSLNPSRTALVKQCQSPQLTFIHYFPLIALVQRIHLHIVCQGSKCCIQGDSGVLLKSRVRNLLICASKSDK